MLDDTPRLTLDLRSSGHLLRAERLGAQHQYQVIQLHCKMILDADRVRERLHTRLQGMTVSRIITVHFLGQVPFSTGQSLTTRNVSAYLNSPIGGDTPEA